MSEFQAEHSDYLKEQIAVFGAERMAQEEGNWARQEDLEAFIGLISTLTDEMEPQQGTRRYREIERKGGRLPLELYVNPEGITGFGDGILERAVAAVGSLKDEDKRLKAGEIPGLPKGKYHVTEDIYIEDNGAAAVIKSIYPYRKKNIGGKIAFKYATTQEIDEAIDIITNAVRHQNEARSKKGVRLTQ